MSKLIKIKKDNPNNFKPTISQCIVCKEEGLLFEGYINYHLCNKCMSCVKDNQSLILESMYEDDNAITMSTRAMIIEKSIINTKSKIVFLSHNEFDKLYNQYCIKMN